MQEAMQIPDCVTKNVTMILMTRKGNEAQITKALRSLPEISVYTDTKTGEVVIANLNEIEQMNCGCEYSVEAQFSLTGPEELLEASIDGLSDCLHSSVIPYGARIEDRTELLLA